MPTAHNGDYLALPCISVVSFVQRLSEPQPAHARRGEITDIVVMEGRGFG
jgi:hypothetical protein